MDYIGPVEHDIVISLLCGETRAQSLMGLCDLPNGINAIVLCQVFEQQDKDDDDFGSCTNRNGTVRDEVKVECHRKAEVDSSADMSRMSSDNEFREWNQPSVTGPGARAGSSSNRASSTQPLNPSNRFLSRFSFIPGNVSFRLSRATSLRSSRDYDISPTNLPVEDNEEDFHLHGSPPGGLVNLNGSRQGRYFVPMFFMTRSDTRCNAHTAN